MWPSQPLLLDEHAEKTSFNTQDQLQDPSLESTLGTTPRASLTLHDSELIVLALAPWQMIGY